MNFVPFSMALVLIWTLPFAAAADINSDLQKQFNVRTDLKIVPTKSNDPDPGPRFNNLRVWYEQRGNYDLVHVDNWGASDHVRWEGRVYELGQGCPCAEKVCIASACNDPYEDVRAYAGEHRCMPILSLTSSQVVSHCP